MKFSTFIHSSLLIRDMLINMLLLIKPIIITNKFIDIDKIKVDDNCWHIFLLTLSDKVCNTFFLNFEKLSAKKTRAVIVKPIVIEKNQ